MYYIPTAGGSTSGAPTLSVRACSGHGCGDAISLGTLLAAGLCMPLSDRVNALNIDFMKPPGKHGASDVYMQDTCTFLSLHW